MCNLQPIYYEKRHENASDQENATRTHSQAVRGEAEGNAAGKFYKEQVKNVELEELASLIGNERLISLIGLCIDFHNDNAVGGAEDLVLSIASVIKEGLLFDVNSELGVIKEGLLFDVNSELEELRLKEEYYIEKVRYIKTFLEKFKYIDRKIELAILSLANKVILYEPPTAKFFFRKKDVKRLRKIIKEEEKLRIR